MNKIKSIFVTSYITLLFIATAHSAYLFWQTSQWIWLGSLIAAAPMALTFLSIFLLQMARTGDKLYLPMTFIALGEIITIYFALTVEANNEALALVYALGVGGLGYFLYDYWYSRFDQRSASIIRVGHTLPDFELETSDKQTVASSSFLGNPALFLFYRGNWCPFCVAQVKEIVEQYNELSARGVQLVMVSPQPHGQTQSLADRFDVPIQFLVDHQNKAAKVLEIFAESGTPGGLQALGYDSDTVMPTVIIQDAKGKVIFADLTDNYRVRPEPDVFLNILDKHAI